MVVAGRWHERLQAKCGNVAIESSQYIKHFLYIAKHLPFKDSKQTLATTSEKKNIENITAKK